MLCVVGLGEGDAVALEVALAGDALGELGDVDGGGTLDGQERFEAGVHQVEGEADGEDADDDSEHDGDLLLPGRGADKVAGLEVLCGVSGVGCGDADDAADGDGESSEGGSGPATDEEDGGGCHESGDGHSADGRCAAADDANDAGGDGDEEEPEENDEDGMRLCWR